MKNLGHKHVTTDDVEGIPEIDLKEGLARAPQGREGVTEGVSDHLHAAGQPTPKFLFLKRAETSSLAPRQKHLATNLEGHHNTGAGPRAMETPVGRGKGAKPEARWLTTTERDRVNSKASALTHCWRRRGR